MTLTAAAAAGIIFGQSFSEYVIGECTKSEHLIGKYLIGGYVIGEHASDGVAHQFCIILMASTYLMRSFMAKKPIGQYNFGVHFFVCTYCIDLLYLNNPLLCRKLCKTLDPEDLFCNFFYQISLVKWYILRSKQKCRQITSLVFIEVWIKCF